MIDSGKFAGKRFLLIDKEPKIRNDRTWCFWEKESGYFESIVYKKWDRLLFRSEKLLLPLDIAPYQYKMIRGIDFYDYCFSKIHRQRDIDIKYGEISFERGREIKINDEILPVKGAVVFNSIYLPAQKQENKFYLLQHFKGWIIETPTTQFDPACGTLMDFNMPQDHGASFVYLLPLTPNMALVEYTLFTKELLQQQEYGLQLRTYINQHLKIASFTIREEEFGIIPMTNAKFKGYQHGMYNIGTAGGQTKASTGYTFRFIQKHAAQIVEDIMLKKHPAKKIDTKRRFHFYDSTLLHILSENKLPGKEIFTQLFQKNSAAKVFKFLDNETTINEELKIISTLPKKQFLTAGIKELLKIR